MRRFHISSKTGSTGCQRGCHFRRDVEPRLSPRQASDDAAGPSARSWWHRVSRSASRPGFRRTGPRRSAGSPGRAASGQRRLDLGPRDPALPEALGRLAGAVDHRRGLSGTGAAVEDRGQRLTERRLHLGPRRRHRASGTSWSGHRTPTVASSSPRSAARSGRRGTTRVSGPGQYRPMRRAAIGGTAVATVSTWSAPATSRGRSTVRGLRLMAKRRSEAPGLKGSTPRP